MGAGYRRHIHISLKEEMVVMHARHLLSKSKIAYLMGVHPSTVRRTLRNVYTTGSIVKTPLQVGGRRVLNGIDCAVRNSS
jgi:transposase